MLLILNFTTVQFDLGIIKANFMVEDIVGLSNNYQALIINHSRSKI